MDQRVKECKFFKVQVRYEIPSLGVSGVVEADQVLKKVRGKYKWVLPTAKIKKKIRERHNTDAPIKIIR